MEIQFYSNKRKIEKKIIAWSMIWTWDLQVTSMMPYQARLFGIYTCRHSIWSINVTFNELKVSQSRAIIDRFCQKEGFELTYYIETLRCGSLALQVPFEPNFFRNKYWIVWIFFFFWFSSSNLFFRSSKIPNKDSQSESNT